MYSLIQLTTNEWLKITKKKSFYISLALVVAITLGAAIFIKAVIGNDFMSAGKFGGSMIALSGGGFLYLVLSAITAAGIVAREHQQGTIKLLLIRSHSRTSILASKLFAMIVYMVVLALFTVAISYIIGLLFFSNFDGLLLGETFSSIAYTFIYTFSYVVIAFMFSTLLKSTGATIGIVLSLTFIESLVVGLLYRYNFAKYILFFHTDFSQYGAEGYSPIEELTPAFSAMMYSLYMIVFLVLTFVVFKKRDVA